MQASQPGFSNTRLLICWPRLIRQGPTDQTVSAKGLAEATKQGVGAVGHTEVGTRVFPREQLQSTGLPWAPTGGFLPRPPEQSERLRED